MKAWMGLCVKVIIKDYCVPVSQQLKHGCLLVGEAGVGVGCTHESQAQQTRRVIFFVSFKSDSFQSWENGRYA